MRTLIRSFSLVCLAALAAAAAQAETGIIILNNYAELSRKMNREAEAVELEARAKEIRAKDGKK